MRDSGFFEFQTPILTASSPEGARDFLVPSRMHPGKFYALPQAPQQFKQLIMIAGFDRYFQIAPCFRDEDARADRSPGEFYQLDLEMSFVEQEDVFAAVEPVMRGVFEEFARRQAGDAGRSRASPTTRRSRKYGSDKPDLRNPIEMQDVTEHFRGSGFKVFAGMIEKDPKARVWAIPAPGGGSRAFCDRMNGWAQKEGQPGLGYIFWREGRGRRRAARRQAPIAKNIGPGARPSAIREAARPEGRRCRVLRRRQSGQVLQVRRRGAHHGRPRAEADRRGPLRVLLDRRLPDVRVERGGEEDRLLPQPVLDAAGRARGAGGRQEQRGPARRSRPTSTTSSATAWSCPRAPSATTCRRSWCKAFEIAGYDARRAGGQVRRHAEGASSTARRRTAASRPASTASSCCWPAPPTCATSSCSR